MGFAMLNCVETLKEGYGGGSPLAYQRIVCIILQGCNGIPPSPSESRSMKEFSIGISFVNP